MNIETGCFLGSFLAYVLAFLAHVVAATMGKPGLYKAGRWFTAIGAIFGTAGLGFRWQAAGHPPLSNMQESMYTLATFFAWISLYFTASEPFPLIEAGAAVLAILMTGTGSVFASEVRPLVPALQSYWLHLHVSIAFLGESCFALSFILSYLYCARKLIEGGKVAEGEPTVPTMSFQEKAACVGVVFGVPFTFLAVLSFAMYRLSQHPEDATQKQAILFWVLVPAIVATALFFLGLFLVRGAIGKTADRWLPPLDRLDELTYRGISLGYPLFTVGAIIFGMVWANKAWGRYWGWDPKETWALITFLVYSGYLHLRLTKGWRGVTTAVLSVVGFLFTIFTLFGVNLILSGLHSYAAK